MEVTIDHRRIYPRLSPIGKALIKRGFMVYIHLDGRLWRVGRKDRGWYVGQPA